MNIVLFDGVCNLCNSTVLFLIKHDTNNQLYFSAQQTDAGKKVMYQNNIVTNNNSVIFIKGTQIYYKSDAIIEITKMLTGWPKILHYGKVLPKLFRNALYDFIAKNRYKTFGKKAECTVPSEEIKYKFLS
jgi:predicted DCC family thiol-disulfide oxidoreductase YuxK